MAARANIVKVSKETAYELRGAARQMISAREHECILAGPSDTGKTFPCCIKLHLYCMRVPGCQGAIVRKTAASLAGTVLRTFQTVIKGQGVRPFGGETPSKFIYQNGSVVWCGGMDNPDRVLSSERDVIYVCQAEELTLNDWEYLATRCSGRGAVVKYPQLFGDCNPGGSRHWIRLRAKEGKLRMLNSLHKDNPTIYDRAGNLTENGKARLAVLDNLSGVRRLRLKEGVWATAEGAVYDTFNSAVHVQERPDAEMIEWMLCEDEGYTNPAAILLVGKDGDGRWHIRREFYQRGVLEQDVVAVSRDWWVEKQCRVCAVDEAAAGLIAALIKAGIGAQGGKGRLLDGIRKIQDRLKVQGDGKPRLTVDPSCVNTVNEFESYIWKPEKDVPVDADNHSLGALRYLEDVAGTPCGYTNASDFLVDDEDGADRQRFDERMGSL